MGTGIRSFLARSLPKRRVAITYNYKTSENKMLAVLGVFFARLSALFSMYFEKYEPIVR